ncbi:MAG TPA: SpoIIE family protein phosphatase, partial [Rubrobacter sp.]|nr:SpoIIE family protein phosphatase [Rubrobacter sp.]
NKALARRFLEAQDEADVEALDELLAPDFVDHTLLPGQVPGREGYIRMIVEDIDALSDVRTTIDYQAVDGDMVITRQTSYSTHDRGELRGLLPTGRERETTGIVIHRISGGKIVEEWSTNSVGSFVEDLVQEMRQREHIERELQVARTIQQASLPREVPQLEGWKITPIYQPAREVGGDFYDFLELDDGRLGIVVGDATGHGVPAALVMASARSMLRAVAQASNSPGDALRRVNDPLATEIPRNMFVTCFYCILDPKSGSLSYANAGHDLPYVWHGGACEELRARGMPLGLMPGMHYEQKEIVLQKGESALLYTDGLVEAHNPQREMFGFPRLQTLVSEHAEEERSLEEALLEELYSFVGEGWEQEDDITLLTLRRSAAPS